MCPAVSVSSSLTDRRPIALPTTRSLDGCRRYVTELGRVASHFYIKHTTIEVFNSNLKRHMSEAEVRPRPRFASSAGNIAYYWAPIIQTLL